MPIYEYACDKCSHEFEVEQRITEDPVKSCPKCRGRKVRRLISQTSFVLKGGGWYSDLYSSPGGGKDDPDKGAGGKGDKGGKESKSDGGSDGKTKPSEKSGSKGGGKKGKGAKAAA